MAVDEAERATTELIVIAAPARHPDQPVKHLGRARVAPV